MSDERLVQYMKAASPILVTLEGMVTDERLVKLSKADCMILVTPSSMTTVWIFVRYVDKGGTIPNHYR